MPVVWWQWVYYVQQLSMHEQSLYKCFIDVGHNISVLRRHVEYEFPDVVDVQMFEWYFQDEQLLTHKSTVMFC